MKNRFMSNDEGCDQAAADAEYAEYIENICSNWKDLTDEELWEAAKTAKSNDLIDAFRAVIAAYKEKNRV